MKKGESRDSPSIMTKTSKELWDSTLWFAANEGATAMQLAAVTCLAETEFKGLVLRSEWSTAIDKDGDLILSFISIQPDDIQHVRVVIDHLGLIETSDRMSGRYSIFDPYSEAIKGGHPGELVWILEDSFFRQFYE